ncbi:hypothetical protein ONE63_001850 [Megalurothrips usitatus]|uniref:Uncharacterized protein n=1 Tax=Megalurothrips usitatus TaxID=439358 RepID=A0AAV7XBZ9_9NEOP|nr:hypothetical protein ONE63_001850 [Megalurothrips usitatus]
MDKDKSVESVVSESLACIIRRSLNAPFRSECHLLLGVSSSTDVQDAICRLLNGNQSKKTVDSPPRLPQNQSSKSSDIPDNFHSDEQDHNDCDLAIGTSGQEIVGSCPASDNNTHSSSSPTLCNIQSKSGTVASADNPSDEETQLDWDA